MLVRFNDMVLGMPSSRDGGVFMHMSGDVGTRLEAFTMLALLEPTSNHLAYYCTSSSWIKGAHMDYQRLLDLF